MYDLDLPFHLLKQVDQGNSSDQEKSVDSRKSKQHKSEDLRVVGWRRMCRNRQVPSGLISRVPQCWNRRAPLQAGRRQFGSDKGECGVFALRMTSAHSTSPQAPVHSGQPGLRILEWFRLSPVMASPCPAAPKQRPWLAGTHRSGTQSCRTEHVLMPLSDIYSDGN